MTVRLMRIACWIHKATNTHSQYVILIVLPLLLWLDDVPQCYVVCTFLSSCSLSTVILALKIQGKTGLYGNASCYVTEGKTPE